MSIEKKALDKIVLSTPKTISRFYQLMNVHLDCTNVKVNDLLLKGLCFVSCDAKGNLVADKPDSTDDWLENDTLVYLMRNELQEEIIDPIVKNIGPCVIELYASKVMHDSILFYVADLAIYGESKYI